LLLITVDTLRPDALGWVGGVNATPHLDRLAREGFALRGAVTSVPLTLPAHVSLLTSRNPPRHGVRDNGQVLSASVPTLAEHLRGRGFRTAAFVSGYPLKALFGLDRGFDVYDDRMPHGREGWVERLAPETTAAALEWIEKAEGPWFVWVHFYDPHDPYTPPREFWGPGERGPYDGEVQFVDHAIGLLLDGVLEPARGQTLTVMTADHGEALGEHRERTHGFFLYDSTVTVPLVFHHPASIGAGASEAPLRLVDVSPTCLDLLGVEPMNGVDGVNASPLVQGDSLNVPPAYLETRLPWIYFGWSPLAAIREERWKLIEAPRAELYDLQTDPDESDNLLDQRKQLVEGLREDLAALSSTELEGEVVVDPEAIAALTALGYVGVGGGVGAPTGDLADPKDRVEERERIMAAEAMLRRGEWAQAAAAFEAVLQQDPDSRAARLRAGTALLRLGSLERAIHHLRRAAELDPNRAEARFALGDALMRVGDPAGAAEQWMEMVRLQPRRVEAWINLGIALLDGGRGHDALEALERAADLEPTEPEARRILAGALVRVAGALAADPVAARALTRARSFDPSVPVDDPRLSPFLVPDSRGP
jgi:arylsulfatase A-like enzyme/Tfp pilus assembly protein PilF